MKVHSYIFWKFSIDTEQLWTIPFTNVTNLVCQNSSSKTCFMFFLLLCLFWTFRFWINFDELWGTLMNQDRNVYECWGMALIRVVQHRSKNMNCHSIIIYMLHHLHHVMITNYTIKPTRHLIKYITNIKLFIQW